MRRYTSIPALSGKQLIKLLKSDGWALGRYSRHGLTLTKKIGNQTFVTFVPNISDSLPEGTLQAILGAKQTRIGKKGLLDLLNKYGL
jgi:predicted RNA binding protein YcfA (HicA-like mRNA interferase family)